MTTDLLSDGAFDALVDAIRGVRARCAEHGYLAWRPTVTMHTDFRARLTDGHVDTLTELAVVVVDDECPKGDVRIEP